MEVDCIVNAANSSLLGGGGVDGAIHRAAGPELVHECRLLGGCKTGQAKLTKGYNLQATYIIHTVGPYYRDGKSGESDDLTSCYRHSLELAVDHQIRTIAFPCISTGIFRYPFDEAATIALKTISSFLENNDSLELVTLVCFSENDFARFVELSHDPENWARGGEG